MQNLWMAVTADKYEHPIYIEETARELGEKLGIKANSVIGALRRKQSDKSLGRKIVRIQVDKD